MMNIHKELPLSFPGCPPSPDPPPPFTQISRHYPRSGEYGCVGCPTSPLRFCEASSRIASHRQARCIPTDGQAIRDSPNWAFATRSRTSRPPAIPRTCSCRPYIGWRLSSSAGSSEPSKEGSPANTSPTIWTSSPFASTDAHPGLAARCSTACLSRLFSVLPRQLRPFTSAPDVGNGPQSPGNHYILGSVDLREYPLVH